MNTIAKLKSKNKQVKRSVMTKLLKQQQGGKSIDFLSRVLPDTLYIDVKQSSARFGEPDKTLSEIDPYLIQDTVESANDFLAFLKTKDPDTISKVIMNNGDGFKVKSFDEFVSGIEEQITIMSTPELTEQ